MSDSSVLSGHMCGMQGFDPSYDVCPACRRSQLVDEGVSEENAEEVAMLSHLASGRPEETGPIRHRFAKELAEKMASLRS